MSFEKEMEDREDPAYEGYMECMVTEVKPRDEEIEALSAKLSALKSRLPVNADGDVVLWGDEVWYWDPVENKPMGGKCHSFECLVGEGEFEIGVFVEVIDVTQDLYNSELFSTAESCRAAHEKGE